jgi:hypothetical protein
MKTKARQRQDKKRRDHAKNTTTAVLYSLLTSLSFTTLDKLSDALNMMKGNLVLMPCFDLTSNMRQRQRLKAT